MSKEKPITGEIYHIYTRGVEGREIFLDQTYHSQFITTLDHYLTYDYPLSVLKRRLKKAKTEQTKERIFADLETHRIEPEEVMLISFCNMPTHPHLTLKQLQDNGISTLMHRMGTSYTNYFNIRLERTGRLFETSYKLVRVESDEQLLHLTRYQHINPKTLGLITAEDLINYPWSSLSTYLGDKRYPFVNTETIMSYFSSPSEYLKFVMAEVDKFEPLRLETVAIDDDFGWFSGFRALKEEIQKDRRERFLEKMSEG